MVGVYRRGEEGIFLVLTGYAAITLPLSTPVLMCFFFFSFLSQITSPSGCCQSLPLYVIFHILPLKLLIKLSPGNLSRFPGSPGSSTSQYGADFMVKKKKKNNHSARSRLCLFCLAARDPNPSAVTGSQTQQLIATEKENVKSSPVFICPSCTSQQSRHSGICAENNKAKQ